MFYKGRRLLPDGDLRPYFLRKIQQADLRGDSLIFLTSPLTEICFQVLLETLDEKAVVVWMEAEDDLRSSLVVPRDQRLIEWPKEKDCGDLSLPFHRFRRVIELSLTGGRNLQARFYADRLRDLDNSLRLYWRNRLTWRELGPRWVSNLWKNLPCLKMPHPLPRPASHTVPVVLGAGPGVEDHLENIAKNRENLWVLACDSILPACLDWGIRPDMIACLEAQHHNLKDFASAVDSGLGVFLDLSAHPSQKEVTGGPVYWTLTEFAPLRIFDRLRQFNLFVMKLPALGSVGNYALQIALELWEGSVLVAGLDFRFPLGKTHARGSAHHRHLLSRSNRLTPAETFGLTYPGRAISPPGWRTTPNLEEYRNLFFQQGQGRVIPFSLENLSHATSVWKNYHPWDSSEGKPLSGFLEEIQQDVLKLRDQLLQESPDLKLLHDLDFLWFWDASYPDPLLTKGFLRWLLTEIRRFLKEV